MVSDVPAMEFEFDGDGSAHVGLGATICSVDGDGRLQLLDGTVMKEMELLSPEAK